MTGQTETKTAADYRRQIAMLRRIAETGEQWAEICRLEELAIEAERKQAA